MSVEGNTPPPTMLEVTNLAGLDSGVLEGTFEIQSPARRNGIDMHMTVGFDRRDEEELPPFFVTIGTVGQQDGRPFEFNGRLFHSPTAATFVYGPAFKEKTYAPDRTEFENFESKLEAAQEEGGAGDISACSDAAAETSLESLIRAPRYKGSTKNPVEGTRLFLVEGEINVSTSIDLLVHLAEVPSCGAQMKALGLPSPTELRAIGGELDRHAEDGRVVLGIDRHGLLRSFEATLDSATSQTGKIELKLVFSLQEVNKQVEIPAAVRAEPLAALLRKFGVKPAAALRSNGDELLLGLLEGFGGGVEGRLP